MKFFAGAAMFVVSLALFLYALPRGGKANWLLTKPMMDWAVPLAVIIGITTGATMALGYWIE